MRVPREGQKGVHGRLLEPVGRPVRALDEALIQAWFRSAGVNMTIDNVPADVVFGTLLPCGKTWDVAEDEDLNGIDAGATMASAYETGAPENCGSFSDPMLDKLFTEQNAMLTQAQRQVVLRWAEAVIARQRPARFLCGPDMIAATQGISGYDPNPFTVDSWNSWAWSAKG